MKVGELTKEDMDRIREINLERLKKLKEQGYTKEQLMNKFPIVFVQKYFNKV